MELSPGAGGVPGDLPIPRLRAVPSFVGALDGRQVSVIAAATSVRLGRLWVLCTKTTRPPLFVARLLAFGSARLVGWGRPAGWVDVAEPGLAPHLVVSVPAGEVAALSAEARAALLEAGDHLFCFSVASSGFAALWFKQLHGQDTDEALTQARALLRVLVP